MTDAVWPKPGDAFPLSPDQVGDCPADYNTHGWLALCVLDEGHPPPHVASDGERVVEVWA